MGLSIWAPINFPTAESRQGNLEFQITWLSQTGVYRAPGFLRGQSAPSSTTKSMDLDTLLLVSKHHQLLFRPLHPDKYLGFRNVLLQPPVHALPIKASLFYENFAEQSFRPSNPLKALDHLWSGKPQMWKILDAAHALSMSASRFFFLFNFQDYPQQLPTGQIKLFQNSSFALRLL